MLNITKEEDGKKLTLKLEGRLDTTTSPQLEAALEGAIDGMEQIVFDITDVEYLSSAGLRVLLSTQKTMKNPKAMLIRGANREIREVFEVTGFSDILNVEW